MRLGILTSHPIQYQAPWFRGLAKEVDLEVFFCHRPNAQEQGGAGFGVAFEWDVDLLSGYPHRFLKNVAARPGVNRFSGCDTPEIAGIISGKRDAEREKRMHLTPALSPERRGSGALNSQLSTLNSSTRFDAFIVSGWHLKSYWQAVRACRRAGIPVLVRGDSQLLTPRSWWKRWAKEIVYRGLLRQFDGFLVVGRRNREYLAHYGVAEEKMFFAPHFVDNEWFGEKAEMARKQRAEIRKGWGADDETLVVAFVGKYQAIKRPGDLLEAMRRLQASAGEETGHGARLWSQTQSQHGGIGGRAAAGALHTTALQSAGTNCLAVFVGAGELEKDLRAAAATLGVRAHFAGFRNQSELPAYYAAADVVVLPSESETWGLVVNEAMACGTPAIVSDAVGCAPDLIEEGKTGFVFPVGDASALATQLDRLVRTRHQREEQKRILAQKMTAYSVQAAVSGTVEAVRILNKKN